MALLLFEDLEVYSVCYRCHINSSLTANIVKVRVHGARTNGGGGGGGECSSVKRVVANVRDGVFGFFFLIICWMIHMF